MPIALARFQALRSPMRMASGGIGQPSSSSKCPPHARRPAPRSSTGASTADAQGQGAPDGAGPAGRSATAGSNPPARPGGHAVDAGVLAVEPPDPRMGSEGARSRRPTPHEPFEAGIGRHDGGPLLGQPRDTGPDGAAVFAALASCSPTPSPPGPQPAAPTARSSPPAHEADPFAGACSFTLPSGRNMVAS